MTALWPKKLVLHSKMQMLINKVSLLINLLKILESTQIKVRLFN